MSPQRLAEAIRAGYRAYDPDNNRPAEKMVINQIVNYLSEACEPRSSCCLPGMRADEQQFLITLRDEASIFCDELGMDHL